ncbi:unnamed protein product [Choristocarpus tenellus]
MIQQVLVSLAVSAATVRGFAFRTGLVHEHAACRPYDYRHRELRMSGMKDGERVVIIGGGIVGASTAYHLTLRGIKPLVIERSEVAAAASGKAGGFLAGGWGSGPTRRMHEVSFEMHEELAETLSVTSYRKIPTLQVRGGVRRGSSPAAWLDGQAMGTMMDPDTAQVTPLELTTKLMEAAQEKGATLRIASVEGVQTTSEGGGDGRRMAGVVLDGGEEIECERVVVCMGPWSVLAEEWFGIPVPMQGIKSTSIVYKGSQAVADDPYALFCGEDSNGCHLEVYPRPTGEVYLCGLGGSDYVNESRLRCVHCRGIF